MDNELKTCSVHLKALHTTPSDFILKIDAMKDGKVISRKKCSFVKSNMAIRLTQRKPTLYDAMGDGFPKYNGTTKEYSANVERDNISDKIELDLDVNNISYAFMGYNKLTSLDLSEWDTSNIVYMKNVFKDCKLLKEVNISGWNTAKVQDFLALFQNCTSLEHIEGVIDMTGTHDITPTVNGQSPFRDMFKGCEKLTGLKIKNPPPQFMKYAKWFISQFPFVEEEGYGYEVLAGLRRDQFEIVE